MAHFGTLRRLLGRGMTPATATLHATGSRAEIGTEPSNPITPAIQIPSAVPALYSELPHHVLYCGVDDKLGNSDRGSGRAWYWWRNQVWREDAVLPWHYTTIVDFVDHWQTLVAGLIALITAIITVFVTLKVERQKADREIDALRNSLAVELRQLIPRALGAHTSLKKTWR